MDHFDYAIEVVLKNEGGWSDDPYDSGGPTNMGITFRLYKSVFPSATLDDLKNLKVPGAKDFYKKQFWNVAPFGNINSMRIATTVFDASVNSGIPQASRILQRSCNEMLSKDSQITVDGVFGKNTLKIANNLDSTQLLNKLRNQRKLFYMELVRIKPTNKRFLNDWLRRADT